MRWRAWLASASIALAGACEPASVPGRPAWDQDVAPLLQGSCNHCHGESVGKLTGADGMRIGASTRLDFCDANASALKEVGVEVGLGAAQLALVIADQLKPQKETGRPKMPPPPAAPLSEYEHRVLERWVKIAMADVSAACLKAVRNRPPRVELVDPPRQGEQAVEAVIEITDPNNDGVVGKATLGGSPVDIPGAGRRTLRFPKSALVGGMLDVVVTDGYDVQRMIESSGL